MPKAELHVHVEGTLEPEMMFEMAASNGVRLRYGSAEEVRDAYDFADLQSFLDLYYEATRVLIHESDFYDLALAYITKAASQGVRHPEIFFDPQAHTDRGVAFGTADHGPTPRPPRRPEAARRLLAPDLMLPQAPERRGGRRRPCAWPSLTRVGSSALASTPPRPATHRKSSKRSSRKRLSHGFHRVAHAGEEGPPEYIRQALDVLGAERIDHGVRCVEDPALTRRLRDGHVPLTVCPLSNVRLRIFPSIEEHPAKQMLRAELRVTLNSDDPAYFGGYVADNYPVVRDGLGFRPRRLSDGCGELSSWSSFLDEGEKRRHLDGVGLLLRDVSAAPHHPLPP